MYYHYYEEGVHNVAPHEGIQTQRYKLIHYYEADRWELFDLREDPTEMKSIYADPKYGDVLVNMKSELNTLKQKYEAPSRGSDN